MAEKRPALAVWRDEKAYISLGDEGNSDPRSGRARPREPYKVIALVLMLVLLSFGGARTVYHHSFNQQPKGVDCGAPMYVPKMVADFKEV